MTLTVLQIAATAVRTAEKTKEATMLAILEGHDGSPEAARAAATVQMAADAVSAAFMQFAAQIVAEGESS